MDDRFKPELLPDEKLLWTGQPGLGLFTAADFFLIPMGLAVAAFGLFWEAVMFGVVPSQRGAPPAILGLFGLPPLASSTSAGATAARSTQ
jgi:hypothetical protein